VHFLCIIRSTSDSRLLEFMRYTNVVIIIIIITAGS